MNAGGGDSCFTAQSVSEECVTTIYDDVAGLETLSELANHSVSASAGLNHDDRGARLCQRGNEVVDGLRRNEACLRVLGDELLGACIGAVVDGNSVAFAAGEVTCQVRTHNGESNDSDVCLRAHECVS